MTTMQSAVKRFSNLQRLHIWHQYHLLAKGFTTLIRYVHDNSTTGNHWHHNAQTFIGSAHNIKTGKTSGKILLRANKQMIILREIGLSFFSFNLLHYLESVILNTTTLTMTTMQSTVKRADSEQYNDIAIIIKIM